MKIMTETSHNLKKCGFCGEMQMVTAFSPAGTWAAFDLDTRPAALSQAGLRHYMQVCRRCGYCRTELEAETSQSIKEILDEPFNQNELHQRYSRAYKIECRERGLSRSLIILLMCAAWCCDDESLTEAAKTCRQAAIDALNSLVHEKNYLLDIGDYLLLIDLCRRAGLFEDARQNIDKITNENIPELERKVLNLEHHLIAVADDGRHTVCEALNFGKQDNPGEKMEALIPGISPDDKYLGTVEITGTFAVKNFEALSRQLKNGDQVLLCREPVNKYDRNAIRVDTLDGCKLGYIPKAQNREPAQLLDDGNLLYGRISGKSDYESSLMVEIFQSIYFKSIPGLAPIESIHEFEFEISSWGCVLFKMYIDGGKNNLIKMFYSSGEAYTSCNIKLEHPFGDEIPDRVVYKEIRLPKGRFKEFVNALSDCRINYWEQVYDDANICDGVQWELEISYNGGKLFKCYGSNQCPTQWGRLIETLSEYIDPVAGEYRIII